MQMTANAVLFFQQNAANSSIHHLQLLKLFILAAMLLPDDPFASVHKHFSSNVMNAIIPRVWCSFPAVRRKVARTWLGSAKFHTTLILMMGEDLAGRCMFPLSIVICFLGATDSVPGLLHTCGAVKASTATDADCIRHLHRRRPQINIWWRLVVLISDLTEIVYYMGFTC